MYIQSLLLTIKGLSPEGKYLLVQLIRYFDIYNPIDSSAVQLAKLCGVSRKVIVPSMVVLSEAGLIAITNKGKVKKAYQFSSGFFEALEVIKKYRQPLSYSKALIDELLDSNCEEHDSLNVSHKLLLSLLLAQADSFGIVHDFSIADISKFTGMKRERVRTQIRKLMTLKYIIYRVSGINNDLLLGKKKGSFYLDLDCNFRASIPEQDKVENVMHINNNNFYNVEILIREMLRTNEKKDVKYKQHNLHDLFLDDLWFKTISKILPAKNLGDKYGGYFQYALEQYTCHMLSKYSEKRCLLIEEREVVKIRRLKSLFLANKLDGAISDKDVDNLLFYISMLVSNQYLELIDREWCKHDGKEYTYQIKILSDNVKVLSRCANSNVFPE
ncbi:hypothetical protein [Aliivibrio sifiae]|uniref:Uncharacterized protein n=1 Tax=Aliivibrio sifiae TaxID=566293 RepID=A0A2S7XJ91_9GAMM|nr:hypothetical protein [Aliivibrio sifiae]PQJ93548.1 hypothetical protein BTO23_05505 [Aliivibrio sifiae]GLR74357.1 hypothetical protein GCM10007855_12310 [Aliivibrio sifiae]